MKAVAVLTGRPDYFLAAKKEFKSLRDLKGKRIAIGTFGAAADIALRVVLRQEGLDPERDVIRLQLGGALHVSPRWLANCCYYSEFSIQSAGGKIGLQRPALAWERLEMPLSGVGVRDETIQKNPGQVLGLLRAIHRALLVAKANPEETIQVFMEWTRVDRELATKSYELGTKSWPDNLIISDAHDQSRATRHTG